MEVLTQLKDKILMYLDLGHSPTIVSMPDDGLSYLFETLLEEPNKDEYTFLHTSLRYIEDLTVRSVELEINKGLTRDRYPGDTVHETNDAGHTVVVILDDILFTDIPSKAVEICDSLIKKYRNNLRFIYPLEHPSLIDELELEVPHYSSIIDAVIYQSVNSDWNIETLTNVCESLYSETLNDDVIADLSEKSNNHFGIFTRMYRDIVLGSNHLERYLRNIVDEFEEKEILIFQKIQNKKLLTPQELPILAAYQRVGFLDNHGNITIPILKDLIPDSISNLGDETKTTSDTYLDSLSKSERKIVRTLQKQDTFLNKHDVADIIWGDKANDKYSEWAIDQRMSRLRRNLQDAKAPFELKTIYGKGYTLTSV